ncbi:uncharacterized protein B0T23DRAFT_383502 [Neurospora hispaniola]|uniref:Secreted protein n=1 Tax=Neurospora hispaniola TaxID=588809 RepID=A0AAJ0I6W9_9PEZI|nr:hypothetical protein B0T23DRAFT_383502 [Neurospora hispaniola]
MLLLLSSSPVLISPLISRYVHAETSAGLMSCNQKRVCPHLKGSAPDAKPVSVSVSAELPATDPLSRCPDSSAGRNCPRLCIYSW